MSLQCLAFLKAHGAFGNSLRVRIMSSLWILSCTFTATRERLLAVRLGELGENSGSPSHIPKPKAVLLEKFMQRLVLLCDTRYSERSVDR
jgi:hypothetical protein